MMTAIDLKKYNIKSSDFEVLDEGQSEYECSVKIQIPKQLFDGTKQNHESKSLVLYYGNYRIVDGTPQIKIKKRQQRFVKVLNGILLPIVVSENVEINIKLLNFNEPPHTIKDRFIIFKTEQDNINIRIALEAEIVDIGINFFLSAEVEVPFPIVKNFDYFFKRTRVFWRMLTKLNALITAKRYTEPIAPSRMHAIPSRRFVPIHKLSSGGIKIYTPKFDGGKAKLIFNYGYCSYNLYQFNGDGLLHSNDNLYMVTCSHSDIFSNYKNIIFQLELMSLKEDEKFPNAIIVDVVGLYKGKDFHMLLVDEAFSIINNLPIKNPNEESYPEDVVYLTLKNNKETLVYRLCKQHEISVSDVIPKTFDKCDGKLLMVGHDQVKIKIPTCDVFIFDNYMKVNKFNYSNKINQPNGLYEITFNEAQELVILRRRFDRKYDAEDDDIDSFIKDWQFFYNKEFIL